MFEPADTWEIQTYGAATPSQRKALGRYGYKGWPIPWAHLTRPQACVLLERYASGKRLWRIVEDGESDTEIIRPEPTQQPLFARGVASNSRKYRR